MSFVQIPRLVCKLPYYPLCWRVSAVIHYRRQAPAIISVMASSIKSVGRENVVVMLAKGPSSRSSSELSRHGAVVEISCIEDAIDRISDFTTDSWPDVLLVKDGSEHLLALMAEVCASAGVRLISERERIRETAQARVSFAMDNRASAPVHE